MREVIFEAAKMTDKASALEHIAKKLNFPDYFGKNFDALNDCLTDISEETEISFDDISLFKSNLGISADMILKVLNHAAKQNGALKIK